MTSGITLDQPTKVQRTRGCRCQSCFGRKARIHSEVTETVWVWRGMEFPTKRAAVAYSVETPKLTTDN